MHVRVLKTLVRLMHCVVEHGSTAVIVGSGNTSQVPILGCVQVFAGPLCKEQRNSDAERPMDNENEISLTQAEFSSSFHLCQMVSKQLN